MLLTIIMVNWYNTSWWITKYWLSKDSGVPHTTVNVPDVLDVHSWHEFIKAIMNMPYEDFLIERRKLMAAKIKVAFETLKKAATWARPHFYFATLSNYSKIRTPQGLHPTVTPNFGAAEICNWIKRTRASEVSIWPRKPLFYAFFGGFGLRRRLFLLYQNQ